MPSRPTPPPPGSSRASASLDVPLAPPWRPGAFAILFLLAAWAALSGAARLPAPVRCVLAVAVGAVTLAGLRGSWPRPAAGAICRLRHPAAGPARQETGWQLVDGRGGVCAARLVTCLPVGEAGWWLGFRSGGRSCWLWVEARTVAPAEYRHLCRLLRAAHGEGRPVDGA